MKTKLNMGTIMLTIINSFTTLAAFLVKKADASDNHGQFQELPLLVTFDQ